MKQIFDAVIIGAGLAGLTLAHRLRSENKKIIILEKSAGVGGRLATRREEDCTFDLGVQFIKLNSPRSKVFLTCPLIQAIALLKESDISYPVDLDKISYASSLVGLFKVDSSHLNILDFKYQQNISSEIFSVSNQYSKNVSQNLAFTVVMQPSWSERNFSQDDATSLSKISFLFEDFLTQKGSENSFAILNSQLKKWRYSYPLEIYKNTFQCVGTTEDIVLLGDAFGEASAVGAIVSAWSVPL